MFRNRSGSGSEIFWRYVLFIYLASSIDMSGGTSGYNLLDKIISGINIPYVAFNPFKAFQLADINGVSDQDSAKLCHINKQALIGSDVLIALVNGSPSIGMPIEIGMALECSTTKHVIVIDTTGKQSMVLKSMRYMYSDKFHHITIASDTNKESDIISYAQGSINKILN